MQAGGPGSVEVRPEGLWRRASFGSCQTQGDHAVGFSFNCHVGHVLRHRCGQRRIVPLANDGEDPAQLDPKLPADELAAALDAGKAGVESHAVRPVPSHRDGNLGIARILPGQFGADVVYGALEVVRVAQAVADSNVDLAEVIEVAEAKPVPQLLFRFRRQLDPVPPRQRKQRARRDGTLEMDV